MTIEEIYAEELAEAREFHNRYKDNSEYKKFYRNMMEIDLIHSDLWSIVYDFINENFTMYIHSNLVTGLTYLIEINKGKY